MILLSLFVDDEESNLCAFTLLVKILGKKEPKSKEEPLVFAFEKCKVYIRLLIDIGVHTIPYWTQLLLFLFSFQQITDKPKDLLQLGARMTALRFAMFGQSSMFIFVEGIILCEVPTFSKALCIWFASHYIFNLEYSKPLKEVCLFLQEFVFKLPRKTKKTAIYLTTSSDICKYII